MRQRRGEAGGIFDGTLPCGAAGALGGQLFARTRLRDHHVGLRGSEGTLEMRDDLPGCCAFQPSAMVKGSGVLDDLLPPLTAHVFDGQSLASLQV